MFFMYLTSFMVIFVWNTINKHSNYSKTNVYKWEACIIEYFARYEKIGWNQEWQTQSQINILLIYVKIYISMF